MSVREAIEALRQTQNNSLYEDVSNRERKKDQNCLWAVKIPSRDSGAYAIVSERQDFEDNRKTILYCRFEIPVYGEVIRTSSGERGTQLVVSTIADGHNPGIYTGGFDADDTTTEITVVYQADGKAKFGDCSGVASKDECTKKLFKMIGLGLPRLTQLKPVIDFQQVYGSFTNLVVSGDFSSKPREILEQIGVIRGW
jgi:hypothetical protein